MKRLVAAAAVLALLVGCVPASPAKPGKTVAASTYPLACLAVSILGDVDGIAVKTVVNQPTGCLHDYTLTIGDARVLSEADVILLNGGGLEDFMADALAALPGDTFCVDCGAGLDFLPGEDGDDPHVWMDPLRLSQMAEAVAEALCGLDPAHAQDFRDNLANVQAELETSAARWQQELAGLPRRELITFHDGFAYLAERFDLTILAAIEEEEGSEASARQMAEIIELVKENGVPCIFTEQNGSRRTAQAIARETGASVGVLSLIMSGGDPGLEAYLTAMDGNIQALKEGWS